MARKKGRSEEGGSEANPKAEERQLLKGEEARGREGAQSRHSGFEARL